MRISTGLLIKIIVIVVVLAFLFFTVTQREFPNWVGEINKNPETSKLPYFIFRTMLRMIAAYLLVVLFGITYGIIAGKYERPRKVMMPLLDILQSIPVLGYLPAAILFFVNLFPGELGVEIASVLLIFTGEAWAVTFGVFGAVRSLPEDLNTVGKAFGLRGFRYYRKLLLPYMFPAFITGSILAWGGGWYFLVACEFMTFGGRLYTLPGVGYYLANAVYVQHSIVSAIFGLIVFILLIFSIDKLVWAPLMDYSEKFKVQTLEHEESYKQPHSHIVIALRYAVHSFDDVWESFFSIPFVQKFQTSIKLPEVKFGPLLPPMNIDPRRMRFRNLALFIILFTVVMYFIGIFVAASLQTPLADIQQSFRDHPEAYSIPAVTLKSILRIFTAYIIALVWTLAAGIIITRSKTLSGIFLPIFDVGQSIPALAIFPFIVIIIFKYIGTGPMGLELASVLLLLTGTQWYLLFNLIGAIKHIPGDIIEAANSFGIKDWKFVVYVLLPAIFPGIIVGSIQAWGGAWNASIVSEYINYGGHIPFEATYSASGLTNITADVGGKISTIPCSAGRCAGDIEVPSVGEQNASLELHSASGSLTVPIVFNVSDIGENETAGKPMQIPFSAGTVIITKPADGSGIPLHPYSVDGLGAFISRATAEWGDPWLVTIAIGTMSLTIITLNRTLWSYLFGKAERYKFEMT
ncbi:ABC transporter permease subunit [Candidatus Micrarchaeota archaeon]|nr:ABC transporter permease subunit [Candidatus Micrarchaeota archaeon]